MKLEILALVTTILLLVQLCFYVARHRGHRADRYVPVASWLRAGIYFCYCLLVAWATGTLAAALDSPLILPGQSENLSWLLSTGALTAFVIFAYWGIWARYTIRFDRRLDLFPQVFFGLCWGLTSGLYFLSFWHLALLIGPQWAAWQTWLLAYTGISIWQWLWQDLYWDLYVSPEHDSPWSIKFKVPTTHVPNVTLCLIHFAVFGNYWVFIGLQTAALLGASIAMRMPAPWCKEATPAARQQPFVMGLVRGGGYQSPDPKNDPYLKAAHLPY